MCDYDDLWNRVKKWIKGQECDSKKPDWHIVRTVLRPHRNLIAVEKDRLLRRSDGSKRVQPITKDQFLDIARRAVKQGTYSIADPNIRPGFRGSIICSILHRMPGEFEYQPGRLLVFHRGKRK